MQRSICEWLEWALDLELTRTQAAALQDLLIDEAKRRDKKALEGTLSLVRFWSRASRLNETDRRLIRAWYHPQIVAALTSSQDKTDRWVFSLYRSAYPALAVGQPTVTRWDTDAYAE